MPKPVKDMTTEALEAEMLSTAAELRPINTRRAALDREIKSRADQRNIDIKVHHLFPTQEDKKAAIRALKKMVG